MTFWGDELRICAQRVIVNACQATLCILLLEKLWLWSFWCHTEIQIGFLELLNQFLLETGFDLCQVSNSGSYIVCATYLQNDSTG